MNVLEEKWMQENNQLNFKYRRVYFKGLLGGASLLFCRHLNQKIKSPVKINHEAFHFKKKDDTLPFHQSTNLLATNNATQIGRVSNIKNDNRNIIFLA